AMLGGGIRSEYAVKAELCGMAEMVLPNTDEEARLIEQSFSIPSQKIFVVPNGVESRFADADAELFESAYRVKDFVLFAGQAGAPRKNVIQLLEIAPHINAPVVIIGDFYDDDYGKKCIELAKKTGNVHLIETLDHDSDLLASAYAACKVFVLPSLFETPGIS